MELYRHSGAVSVPGLLLAAVAGTATAVVLGVVYTYLIVYIPFIYINFLLTAGLGFVVGFVVAMAATAGHIRNNTVTAALGFAFGLVALYVAWAADMRARFPSELADVIPWLLLDPNRLLAYVQFYYENGSWSLFSDTPVSGVFLGIIMLLEAVIIVGAAWLTALSISNARPFCERCRRWIETKEGVQRLSLEHGEGTLERLLTGDLAVLNDMARAGEDDAAYLRLDLSVCETCTEANYLTLQLVQHTLDDKGKTAIETKELVEHLVIPHGKLETVRNAGTNPEPARAVAEETREHDAAAE